MIFSVGSENNIINVLFIIYSIIHFNQNGLISMIVTPLLLRIRVLNHYFNKLARFTTANPLKSQLHANIMKTKNIADFMSLYQTNRNAFQPQVLAETSKHLNKLISSQSSLNPKDANQIIKGLQTANMKQLDELNIIRMLSILRSIKAKGYQSQTLLQLKRTLNKRYTTLIKHIQPTQSYINHFIHSYYELASFKSIEQSKLVAQKILSIFRKTQGNVVIDDKQISFLFYCLILRAELTYAQIKIRSYLLKRVQSRLNDMSIQLLAKIVASLNKMELFDIDQYQMKILGKITTKILGSMGELDQNSIYQLIKGENIGHIPGIFKIYEEIQRSLFAEIDQNGMTSIDFDAIMTAFGYLSNKLSLNSASKAEQNKFFAFFNQYAQFCKNSNSKLNLDSLVKNNFFDQLHKTKVMQIIKGHKNQLTMNLLYEFAIKDYDIAHYVSYLQSLSQELKKTYNIINLIKVAVIAHQISTFAPSATKYRLNLQREIADKIATPQKFVEFYKIVRRNAEYLPFFHRCYGNLFEVLPNPLSSSITNKQYRSNYLQYIHDAFSNKEYAKFITEFDSLISSQDFMQMIFHHIGPDQRNLQFKIVLIIQLNKRIHSIIDSKNIKWINTTINFIYKYSSSAIKKSLNEATESTLFQIIKILITKADSLKQRNNHIYLYTVMDKYLSKRHKNYAVQMNYRSLLQHLIKHIDQIYSSNHATLSNSILREGLRLNYITKPSLDKINIQSLKLSFSQRQRLCYIKDNTHIPKIQKIHVGVLQVIFSNHNLNNLLAKEQKSILQLIPQLSPKQLCFNLTIFNHQGASANRILYQMLNNLIAKLKGINGLDIVGVFQNALQKQYCIFFQYKRLSEKIVEIYKEKIHNYSIESHLQLIRFIVSQPNLNPHDYYAQLVQAAEKRIGVSQNLYEQVLLRLASTNYDFKVNQLKNIENIISRNIRAGIYFFLMVEDRLDKAARNSSLQLIIKKLTNWAKQSKDQKLTLNALYYHYLKTKYPNQTKNFELDSANLLYQKFSVRPKNQQVSINILGLFGSGKIYKDFGGNDFVRIKDYIFMFLQTKRTGAYHEQQFMKKAIPIIKAEKCTVVFIPNANHLPSALEYINTACPGLFDPVQYSKTLGQAKATHRQRYSPGPEP